MPSIPNSMSNLTLTLRPCIPRRSDGSGYKYNKSKGTEVNTREGANCPTLTVGVADGRAAGGVHSHACALDGSSDITVTVRRRSRAKCGNIASYTLQVTSTQREDVLFLLQLCDIDYIH
ncbi:hypothetical protein J6590_048304 [Homalodisca vitripennis]|nr:hypothetical protein J6590_048304 [Homalodisca vitripennis]